MAISVDVSILELLEFLWLTMRSSEGIKIFIGLLAVILVTYACWMTPRRKKRDLQAVPSDFEQELQEGPYLVRMKAHMFHSMRFPRGPSKILDFLYLGGETEATNRKLMRDMGITHVINCASGYISTGESFYGEGVKYMGFDAEDELGYDIMQHYEEVYNFIEDARTSGGKAFIHCIMGVNRSGALTVAYVMQHQGIGPISAAMKVRKLRGMILSNEDFQQQVITQARKKGFLHLDKDLPY